MINQVKAEMLKTIKFLPTSINRIDELTEQINHLFTTLENNIKEKENEARNKSDFRPFEGMTILDKVDYEIRALKECKIPTRKLAELTGVSETTAFRFVNRLGSGINMNHVEKFQAAGLITL